jgi:putative salt-induced outer membrane protein YdiY
MASAATALFLSLLAAPASAQDEERPLGASNAAELSWVVASGNSEANTLGFRNLFQYLWEEADLSWESGVVRAESRGGDRFAVGGEDDFSIIDPDRELDTNRAYSKLRYLRNLSSSLFWYASVDSERNRPANVNYRFTPAAGAGNIWSDTDELLLRTGYGISYTAEDLDVDGSNRFAGYQLFYTLAAALTDTTALESNLTFDGSLEDANDIRFDWLNGVGVAINDHIALKANLRLLLRNQPALEVIGLRDGAGAAIGSVVVAKEKLDTTFATSLVINL